jgi:hypothetical protein
LAFGFGSAAAIADFLDVALEAEVGVGLEFNLSGVARGEVHNIGLRNLQLSKEGR